jgi:hypothetical protein
MRAWLLLRHEPRHQGRHQMEDHNRDRRDTAQPVEMV